MRPSLKPSSSMRTISARCSTRSILPTPPASLSSRSSVLAASSTVPSRLELLFGEHLKATLSGSPEPLPGKRTVITMCNVFPRSSLHRNSTPRLGVRDVEGSVALRP
ncbi:hypothetical protein HBI24_015790 [Parastagonospora nodorum]|nr:hypothetical protein HBH54_142680 [Parastagonospora nodorum]KAH3972493.1 hypothetical protein HBH52_152560 [Parastagonospora nodorum]KAH4005222.1 hypothetical protein HBI10_035220 [Parastagonospora nodorum]KAH4188413.1 hypothetical protein HBH42_145430 [Parastagonospora nodorum]KAH4467677.1 hypothetical protein HBH90_084870 [Parastagonospora nodorum]